MTFGRAIARLARAIVLGSRESPGNLGPGKCATGQLLPGFPEVLLGESSAMELCSHSDLRERRLDNFRIADQTAVGRLRDDPTSS